MLRSHLVDIILNGVMVGGGIFYEHIWLWYFFINKNKNNKDKPIIIKTMLFITSSKAKIGNEQSKIFFKTLYY